MSASQCRISSGQSLWRDYRDAFRRFEHEADRLAAIKGQEFVDPAEAEDALSRVEQARLAYNDIRDALAASLMNPESRRLLWTIPEAAEQEQMRVRSIAEFLWEMAGKPQGSADEDWYRAERLVRHAGSEAVSVYAGR